MDVSPCDAVNHLLQREGVPEILLHFVSNLRDDIGGRRYGDTHEWQAGGVRSSSHLPLVAKEGFKTLHKQ